MVYCDSVRTFAELDALMARYDVDECVIERLEELLQSLDERLSLLSAAETEAQERAAASERALLGAERTALIDDIMRHKVALLRSVAKAGCWCKEHGLVGLEPHERVRKPVQGIAPGDISGGLQAVPALLTGSQGPEPEWITRMAPQITGPVPVDVEPAAEHESEGVPEPRRESTQIHSEVG